MSVGSTPSCGDILPGWPSGKASSSGKIACISDFVEIGEIHGFNSRTWVLSFIGAGFG